MCQFGREFLVHFPATQLWRFPRNKDRLERFLRIGFEEIRQLLAHLVCIDVSHYDKGEIIRNVARFVIPRYLFLRELVVNLYVADYRKAVGMSLVGGGKEEQTGHAVWIIQPHGEFAPDYFLFFRVLHRRQSRVHHRISQNIERSSYTIFRYVRPKNSVVKRRIGVDIPADILDFLRDRIGRSRLCPFEEHVLENVRQAGAEMLVFIDAASGAPRLHTCYRSAVIFLHDNRKSIGQVPLLRGARRESDRGRLLDRGGF